MILPFNLRPTLSTYLYQAYPFGILENPALPAALLNWNVQLAFRSHARWPYEHNLSFYPALNLAGYSALGLFRRKIYFSGATPASAVPELAETISQLIGEESYPIIYADYYYIPGTSLFEGRHFRHDLLLYGQDKDLFKGVLYTKGGNMGPVDLTGEQLTAAYTSTDARGDSCAAYCRGDLLMSVTPSPDIDWAEPLDFEGIKVQIDSYLNSSSQFKFEQATGEPPAAETARGNRRGLRDVCFGRSIYPAMVDYFSEFSKREFYNFDLRITRLLCEHKQLMTIRLQRLVDEGWKGLRAVAEQWRAVAQLAQTIHLRAMATERHQNRQLLGSVKTELQKLELVEAKLLMRVLSVER